MDRNSTYVILLPRCQVVALRKESVDRNSGALRTTENQNAVALRKESVDRNVFGFGAKLVHSVALRKESVDRNANPGSTELTFPGSLSARRAWIEISIVFQKRTDK